MKRISVNCTTPEEVSCTPEGGQVFIPDREGHGVQGGAYMHVGANWKALRRTCERLVAEGVLPELFIDLPEWFPRELYAYAMTRRLGIAWCVLHATELLRALSLFDELRPVLPADVRKTERPWLAFAGDRHGMELQRDYGPVAQRYRWITALPIPGVTPPAFDRALSALTEMGFSLGLVVVYALPEPTVHPVLILPVWGDLQNRRLVPVTVREVA
jgi:hypothetical protein